MTPNSLFLFFQYVLPKQLITQCAGYLANTRGGRLTTAFVRWYIRRFKVNLDEAQNTELASYPTFNDFFVRTLKPGVRPISDADFVCPVDGAMSQFGSIKMDHLFQAKGHEFSTADLVGGDEALAAQFRNGQFVNLYLSPRDYHRVHMPCDGRLTRMIYIPGELFSVCPLTAQNIPGLFARNERIVCVFDSETGPFLLIMVGATIVGSMATVWHGVVNPPRRKQIHQWDYSSLSIALKKGEEMGRFLLGSTVIMLFQNNTMRFNPKWEPASLVRLGELMGDSN